MFAVWKRKYIVFILFVVMALQITLTFIACINQLSQQTSLVDFTIMLDAGHGGKDAGVTADDGTKESDLNLRYAKMLGEIFVESGYCVKYTRTGSGGLYGLPTKGFKGRDMRERKRIVEQSNANLLISLHMNKYEESYRKGPQVFFQIGEQAGKSLAQNIQQSLNNFTGNTHQALKGDYYMCREMPCLAVIVECGFLSNAEELAYLKEETYCQNLCNAIFNGVMLYLCGT